MPKDFTATPWFVKRDTEERERAEKANHAGFDSTLRELPPSLGKVRWSVAKIEKAIQRKVFERTSAAERQYREGTLPHTHMSVGVSLKESLCCGCVPQRIAYSAILMTA